MTYRCVVTLNPASQLPRDAIVNTYHMNIVGDAAQARADFILGCETFYDTIEPWFSSLILQTGHEITFYDLDDPEPRQPVGAPYTFDFSTPLSTNRLPAEVAVCLSYRAAYVSGTPNARRRGRAYLGPFQSNAVATTGKVAPTVIEDIADAAQTWWQSVNAGGDGEMVVYSPTDLAGYETVQLWVDDEFDIQRRRGGVATQRETRGV